MASEGSQPVPVAHGFAFAHVYDPQLQAGRGAEFSASAQRERQELAIRAAWDAGDDFRLPMGRVDESLDTEGLQQASLDAAIPSSNRGFQMLQRMGWCEGKGLGRAEDGIVEPVRGGVDAGLRLGVGKAEQESFFVSAENVVRKRLETEVQADEDYERTLKREMAVQRETLIKADTSEAKRNLYCDTCHKQYKNAMEMETHLSSYDHHHTKRLQEMRQATAERTRSERERKERRRAEKEWARLNAQSARAQQSQQAANGGVAAPPPPDRFVPPPPPPDDADAPPPPPPDAPPHDGQQPRGQAPAAALDRGGWAAGHGAAAAGGSATEGQSSSIGSGGGLLGLKFGSAPGLSANKRHATGARGGFGGVGAAAKRQPLLKPAVAAFQLDSDDEEAQ